MAQRRRRGPAARPDVIIQGAGHTVTGSQWPLEGSGASETPGVVSPALSALSERQFQAIVRAELERQKFVVWVVPNMKLTRAGLPDILAWHARLPGLLLALELKRERDARITPAQVAALAHLETVRGVEARILRPSGWPRLRDTLDLMLRHGIEPAREGER